MSIQLCVGAKITQYYRQARCYDHLHCGQHCNKTGKHIADFLLKFCVSNWVFHVRRFCQIIWLSDRFKVTQNKINFVKNCPQWDLNSQPSDHDSNALTTELGRNLLGRRFLKWALFVSCTTSHVGLCSFLESIEHNFIKAMKIQAGNWMLT